MLVAGVWALVVPSHAVAAVDGLFQGAGALLVPVDAAALRLARLDLTIRPVATDRCYRILYKGADVRAAMVAEDFPPQDHAEIGAQLPCTSDLTRHLRVRWEASAVYEVHPQADLPDVTLALPVPTWNLDLPYTVGEEAGSLCCSLPVPGLANPSVRIRGQEVDRLALRNVTLDVDAGSPPQLAYTWRTSFRKGQKVFITVEYEFGAYHVGGFTEGSEYPSGSALWFDNRPRWEVAWGDARMPPAEHLVHNLSTLQAWALPGAPARVKVQLPKHVSALYAVPLKPRPTCVDTHALSWTLRADAPTDDVDVAYVSWRAEPDNAMPLPKMVAMGQWRAWRHTVAGEGAEVQHTCRLLKSISAQAKGELKSLVDQMIARRECVESC
ncbi:MAG: hypothetical protein AB2A00_30975 [Myxococcota bacterium]